MFSIAGLETAAELAEFWAVARPVLAGTALVGAATTAAAKYNQNRYMSSITPAKRHRLDTPGAPRKKSKMSNLRGSAMDVEIGEKKTQQEAPVKIKCVDRDKEGANEYVVSAKKQRVKYRLPYDDLQDFVAPPWSEKATCVSRQHQVASNNELCLEHLIMDSNFVKQRILKGVDMMPTVYELPLGPPNLVNQITSSTYDNQPVKFEGGRVRFTFINTCSNTIHFEINQFKLKQNYHQFGVRMSTQSPMALMLLDQSNSTEIGDLPIRGDLTNPLNTGRLANGSYTINTALTAAQSSETLQLDSDFEALAGTLPTGKRPNPSSPQLRGTWNKIQGFKISLKPGDTFKYEFRMHPFYESKVKSIVDQNLTTNLVQDYSRVVQIYARGEMSISAATGQMANGPCQFSKNVEYDFNWRALPRFKKNQHIETSANSAVLGPYTDFTDYRNIEFDPADVTTYTTA